MPRAEHNGQIRIVDSVHRHPPPRGSQIVSRPPYGETHAFPYRRVWRPPCPTYIARRGLSGRWPVPQNERFVRGSKRTAGRGRPTSNRASQASSRRSTSDRATASWRVRFPDGRCNDQHFPIPIRSITHLVIAGDSVGRLPQARGPGPVHDPRSRSVLTAVTNAGVGLGSLARSHYIRLARAEFRGQVL